ncbi:MAG: hypothetical protein ABI083_20025 [Lapillicoccus sp.]
MTRDSKRRISLAHNVAVANHAANRMLIPLLTGPAGTLLGRWFALVDYRGRRTGQRHQLVTLYARDGRTVRISVGMAEHKTWWRNFEQPYAMRLRLAGQDHDATAHLERDGGRVRVISELAPPTDPTDPTDPTARTTT